jgi:hypothetical protein
MPAIEAQVQPDEERGRHAVASTPARGSLGNPFSIIYIMRLF